MDRELLMESELDYRLNQSNPVDRAALDDEGVRLALASMRLDLEVDMDRDEPSPRPARPRHRRRWATLGMATATVTVASLVGVETLAGGPGGAALPLAVAPAAAAQLGKIARAAAAQPTLGAGQFEYLASKIETTGDPSFGGARVDYTYDQTLQDWAGPAPTYGGRQVMTLDGISFASPQDQANYLANKAAFDAALPRMVSTWAGGDPTATGMLFDHVFPPQKAGQAPVMQGTSSSDAAITDEVMAGTERPKSPRALLADLTVAMSSQPSDLWSGLVVILRDSTNAQLRATAYRALSYVPETTVLGNVTDQLGRAGVAIRFTGYVTGPTDRLIVSPSTGYLLEDDSTTQTPQGSVVQREIDLQRGIVDSVTALPGSGSQPLTAATRTVGPTGTISSGPPAGVSQTTTTSSPATSTATSAVTASQTTTSPPVTASQTTTSPPVTASQTTTTSSPQS